MIASALLLLVLDCGSTPLDARTSPAPAPQAAALAEQDGDRAQEYERRKQAAGENVEALWDLYLWCEAYGMTREVRTCLRAIIKVDPNHREARALLGHVHYDGQWFTTEKALEKYKREEAERIAKEQGLVQYKGDWVPKDDVPFLERGMMRDGNGLWVTAEEYEKLSEGWQLQDLQWIPPDEIENIAKGLWKCGDDWLPLDQANRFRSSLDHWWVIPSEKHLLFSTLDREIANQALELLDFAHRDMRRLFGVVPDDALPVVILRSNSQYNRFAGGPEGQRRPTELRSLSSVHHAYFADSWFDQQSESLRGAGVAFWDASTEAGNRFGPLATRHAAALSFVEGIDPSPKTTAKGQKARGLSESDAAAFWAEKKIPEWLRYGAAAYAERYFIDGLVKAGGNPYWAREWSLENLKARGGLRPLGQVFDTPLTVNDPEGSEKLLNERGLLVAFVLDGNCEPVNQAWAAMKEVMVARKDPTRAITRLRKEIEKHERELRQFAGL